MCIRRISNNIIPGFVQLIEILSGKSFVELVKYGGIRDVVSKVYSSNAVDTIINILVRHIEKTCGKDC